MINIIKKDTKSREQEKWANHQVSTQATELAWRLQSYCWDCSRYSLYLVTISTPATPYEAKIGQAAPCDACS